MKKVFSAVTALCVLTLGSAAWASTASQREYKRGYADCAAGRWDQDQHGDSYKKGCRAAEEKRKAQGGAEAAPAASEAKPAQPADDVPKADKQACLRAVKKQTHNPKAVVLEAVSSEANNTVTVGVGPQRAPWRCLVKRGKVADVMSQTNEGGL